jgi:hypothetical protein
VSVRFRAPLQYDQQILKQDMQLMFGASRKSFRMLGNGFMVPTGKRGNVQHLKPIKKIYLIADGEV